MRRVRVWMWAVIAVSVVTAGSMRKAWSDEGRLVDGEALVPAAYDVILVPREGRGNPRILTERGWRSLTPNSAARGSTAPTWRSGRFERQPRWSGQQPPRDYYGAQRPYAQQWRYNGNGAVIPWSQRSRGTAYGERTQYARPYVYR